MVEGNFRLSTDSLAEVILCPNLPFSSLEQLQDSWSNMTYSNLALNGGGLVLTTNISDEGEQE
jgi:hypothetical protein